MHEVTRVLYTECVCHDPDHVMRFELRFWRQPGTDEPEDPELYINTQLSPRYGFWERLWNATRYVFGHSGRFGHWSEGTISYAQIPQIRELLDEAERCWDVFLEAHPGLGPEDLG